MKNNEDEAVEKYFGEIENKKTKRKVFTELQVLEIIDSCFHCYASDFRSEARERATKLMRD